MPYPRVAVRIIPVQPPWNQILTPSTCVLLLWRSWTPAEWSEAPPKRPTIPRNRQRSDPGSRVCRTKCVPRFLCYRTLRWRACRVTPIPFPRADVGGFANRLSELPITHKWCPPSWTDRQHMPGPRKNRAEPVRSAPSSRPATQTGTRTCRPIRAGLSSTCRPGWRRSGRRSAIRRFTCAPAAERGAAVFCRCAACAAGWAARCW